MNITKESEEVQNKLLSKLNKYDIVFDKYELSADPINNLKFLRDTLTRHEKHLADMKAMDYEFNRLCNPENAITDKLKTTPDAGLTKLPILKIKLRKLFKWWK